MKCFFPIAYGNSYLNRMWMNHMLFEPIQAKEMFPLPFLLMGLYLVELVSVLPSARYRNRSDSLKSTAHDTQ